MSVTALLSGLTALTVDVEDWFHVCGEQVLPAHRNQTRVVEATHLVLDLLREHGVKGTFFMLGEVAAAFPALAPAIVAEGHEIASHGWSHRLVTELSPAEFQDELERTALILEQQTGCKPIGFRAPRWSLDRKKTAWAFEILAKLGYQYDSSLTPHAGIGDPKGPLQPHRIATAYGELLEFPPLVARSVLGNLPAGGGWGFRFFPFALINSAMQQYHTEHLPAVLFVHPRELDHASPRLTLPFPKRFLAYGSRATSRQRLKMVLSQYTFCPLTEILDSCRSAS